MEAAAVNRSNHGANVRRWREWRNINQDVLAEKVGVSQTTLSGYEKKSKLEPEVLEKIAKALDIPVEAFTELGDDAAINIVANNFHDSSSALQYRCTFDPIEKIVELYDEKIVLYERMLKDKENTIKLLDEALKGKKLV